METLKISAKNLGYTALADFCPRCYWIKLRQNFKLPYQNFPGIFSSIDSYTKHVVHHIIDNVPNKPQWMKEMGTIVGYEKVKHWSKNTYFDPKTNITLHGAQDDILVCEDGSRVVPDWKTQRHSDTQDKLKVLYDVQLNVYSILTEQDKHDEVRLFLVYMEPCSEPSYACDNIIDGGFRLCFSGVVVPVERDRGLVRKALNTTREIFQLESPPKGNADCKECKLLDAVIELLK